MGSIYIRAGLALGVSAFGLGQWYTSRQHDDRVRYGGPGACELVDGVGDTLLAAAVPPPEGGDVGVIRDERAIGDTHGSAGQPGFVRAGDGVPIGSVCTVANLRGLQPALRLAVVNAAFDSPGGVHEVNGSGMRLDASFEDDSADDRSRFQSTTDDRCVVTVPATSAGDELAVSLLLEGSADCDAVQRVLDAVLDGLPP